MDSNQADRESHETSIRPTASRSDSVPRQSHPLRLFGKALLLALGAFAAYSGYVAVHEPNPQETVLLGQSRVAADSPAGWRILVRNRTSGKPVPRAKVELTLRNAGRRLSLGRFTTGADGSLADPVNLPNLPPGAYTLEVNTRSRLGADSIRRQVEVISSARVLLTSDKPLYQPGQVMHLRSLVANSRTQKPLAGAAVMFEVSDAKGNKVFKETVPASRFGIAATDFVLASEVNTGRYQVRAVSDSATAERTVEVKRYVLPKFKITLATDQSYYRPGQVVSGSVAAAYFFGKPVSGAAVKLTALTHGGPPVALSQVTGQTDAAGKFRFEFALPASLAGLPQLDGDAIVDLAAEVRDTGEHAEQTTHALAVSRKELNLEVFPEAGQVVPGITNLFYVATTYPDGRPAACRVLINDVLFRTDARGICAVEAAPSDMGARLNLRAWDDQGRSTQLTFTAPAETNTACPLLLRPDRAVYQAGQTARLTVFSREPAATVFIDLIRNRQTVLTRSLQVRNHRGDLAVALPLDLVGTLKLNAYLITETGEDRGQARLVYVNPASGLQIRAKADKPVYLPGETAKLEFQVTDASGRPAPSALGICAVDESLFGLQDTRSGLLSQCVAMEAELLGPRPQAKCFNSFERLLEPGNELLAQAYFAALTPRPAGPRLEEILTQTGISPRLLERVRQWRGTPRYESWRQREEYQAAIQFLENGRGDYSLMEATGPAKKWAMEQYRQKYFRTVGKIFNAIVICLVLGCPLTLLIIAVWKDTNALITLLVCLAILFIAAGLLLPALAKAKARAQHVSAESDLKQLDFGLRVAESDGLLPKSESGSASSPPRVRSYFPETLFWRPELITDDHGKALVEIPLADSITTWRTSLEAVGASGGLGSAEVPIRVFQDFFIDPDLPVSLTLGDEVSLPVICYNYLADPQQLRVTLEEAGWFEAPAAGRVQTIQLAPNEVKALHFPIRATRVGIQRCLISAQGTKAADAVAREIRVLPAGREWEQVENRMLHDRLEHLFTLPPGAIPGAASLVLKLYPSRFSEIVEGLDTIFQAPYGCFEQTSSTTYPNVLALDYLKNTGRLKPEIELKARKYINAGYQRLLTFEVPGGGFEWFGHSPANIPLTAYGILEFTDMARVHPVDEAMVARTVAWLFSRQNADGSWGSGRALHSWAENPVLVTTYTAWALAESGNQSASLDKALAYLQAHARELDTTYARALAANALLARDRNDAFGRELVAALHQAARPGFGDTVSWNSTGQSMTYSTGESLTVETTALCALALLKSGLYPQTAKAALAWLSAHKNLRGLWPTTQATILAMRALLQGTGKSFGQEFTSQVTVSLNGQRVETLRIDKDNSDVMRLVSLTERLVAGPNRVELRQDPPGQLPCQITGVYWTPEPPTPLAGNPASPLEIEVQYDRTTLAVAEQIRPAVTVRNHTGQDISMAIVDLGIPPGFALDGSAFETMQARGQLAKYEVAGNHIILYLRGLPATAPLQFTYALTAKYPLRVETPPAVVYEYYTPARRASSRVARLLVQ